MDTKAGNTVGDQLHPRAPLNTEHRANTHNIEPNSCITPQRYTHTEIHKKYHTSFIHQTYTKHTPIKTPSTLLCPQSKHASLKAHRNLPSQKNLSNRLNTMRHDHAPKTTSNNTHQADLPTHSKNTLLTHEAKRPPKVFNSLPPQTCIHTHYKRPHTQPNPSHQSIYTQTLQTTTSSYNNQTNHHTTHNL